MVRLVVEAVSSAGELRRSLSPGAADEYGEYEGGELVVADDVDPQTLVDTYPNVRWADTDAQIDTHEPQMPRGELDGDGVGYKCGVNGCSRDVDSPDATCWQHEDD